ncbi:UNVERIFIED_CONTAM: helix-turn-helix domain-containing protein [Kocuria sp. CPCC 205274]
MSEDLAAWAQSRQQPKPAELVPDDGRMTPIELKVVREALGLSREQLAAALNVGVRSVDDWESGRRPVPDGVRDGVERIEAFTAEVADQLVAHLLEHAGPDPVFEVYDRDADMPALDLPGAPLAPTARWWRAVAYRVAADVPGLRIVEAPK